MMLYTIIYHKNESAALPELLHGSGSLAPKRNPTSGPQQPMAQTRQPRSQTLQFSHAQNEKEIILQAMETQDSLRGR